MTAKKTTKPKVNLPKNVLVADTSWPKGHDDHLGYEEVKALGLDDRSLTFYEVRGFGWVILTLGISKARGRQTSNRSYGVRVDNGTVCRVGAGPHVLSQVTVYLSKKNIERLKPYVELYVKGLGDAGMIRDRIGSRRAEGQARRANGESYWRWSN